MDTALSSYLKQLPNWFLAFVTTMGLFLIMKIMVTGQEYKIEEAAGGIAIDFVRVEREEDLNTKDRAAKRPTRQEPEPPPPPPQLDQVDRPDLNDNNNIDANFGLQMGMNLNAPVDGDALAIVRVLPRYPNRALSRGIEGWVLLEFTINAIGQAMTPIVVDSDPAGIFDRAAINAVKKWKYRPKTEEGRAVPRPGVRQMITFQISKD